MKTVLTIAGSDSIGGAGIEADIKTISLSGLHPMTTITAVTMQNTLGVKDIFPVSPDFVYNCIQNIFDDITPNAVKIGMLYSDETALAVFKALKERKAKNIVLDPILISGTGQSLSNDNIIKVFENNFFGLCTLVTPNAQEASKILNMRIETVDDAKKTAKILENKFKTSFLIKGGHLNDNEAYDVLISNGKISVFSNPRIPNCDPHGTGCVLSSKIATNLALGKDIHDSVYDAKNYLYEKMKNAKQIGKGKKLL